MASYARQLLAPVKGFGRGFVCLLAKKSVLDIVLAPFGLFFVFSSNLNTL